MPESGRCQGYCDKTVLGDPVGQDCILQADCIAFRSRAPRSGGPIKNRPQDAILPHCAKIEFGCLAASPVMLQSLIQLLPSPPKLTLMGVVDILIVAFLIYEL